MQENAAITGGKTRVQSSNRSRSTPGLESRIDKIPCLPHICCARPRPNAETILGSECSCTHYRFFHRFRSRKSDAAGATISNGIIISATKTKKWQAHDAPRGGRARVPAKLLVRRSDRYGDQPQTTGSHDLGRSDRSVSGGRRNPGGLRGPLPASPPTSAGLPLPMT